MSTRVTRSFPFVLLSLAVGVGLALAVSGLVGAEAGAPATAQPAHDAQASQSPGLEAPSAAAAAGTVYYVSYGGDGSNGLSWTTAFTDLQVALATAVSGDEIWVASGVYTPGTTVSDTFSLVPGASLLGGFAGTPGTEGDPTARDWKANLTILSGDIGGDDVTDANGVITSTDGITGTNSFHVVSADGAAGTPITGTTRLDGFTITGGQANGAYPGDSGGGFYCDGSGSGSECSPSLRNVIFSGNAADYCGGGMANYGQNGGFSGPSVVDVTFFGNTAAVWGGAMYNDGFDGESSPNLTNVTFSDNTAGYYGGAMAHYAVQGVSSPGLVNVTFSGNAATYGGGAMFNYAPDPGVSSPQLTNVILWNDAGPQGAEIRNTGATPIITTSLVSGGITGTLVYNDGTSSVTDGGGNLSGDPRFVRTPDPGDGDWFTPGDNDYGDLRLRPGSPAIDAGTNSAVTVSTDLDGAPRISHGVVDVGAYEFVRSWVYLPLALR